MKIMPFRVARTYRDLSYLFLLALLVATAIAPVFASPQASGTVTLSLTNVSAVNAGIHSTTGGIVSSVHGTVVTGGDYVTYSSSPYTVTTTQYVIISGHIVGTNTTTSGNG